MATITIIRGDDEQFETTLTDENGDEINLNGFTIFFTVKSKDDFGKDDEEAIIAKKISDFSGDDDPTNGMVNILLTNLETDVEPGEYYRDIQIKSPLGLISSCTRGKFVVEADSTRDIA